MEMETYAEEHLKFEQNTCQSSHVFKNAIILADANDSYQKLIKVALHYF